MVTRIVGGDVSCTGNFTDWSEEGIAMSKESGDGREADITLPSGQSQRHFGLMDTGKIAPRQRNLCPIPSIRIDPSKFREKDG